MNTISQPKTDAVVSVPDTLDIKNELALADPAQIKAEPSVDAELDTQAREVAKRLLTLNPDELESVRTNKAAIETMGLRAQQQAAQKSEMLKEPIGQLAKRSNDGGQVANALVELKLQVEELDPAKFDFSPGWFSRLFGFLPFIGKPIKRYFTRFESSQTVLAAIKGSLLEGQKQLRRDNITLSDDQIALQELNVHLEKAVKLGQLVDLHLTANLDREQDQERRKFIEEELLFPLRQRIQDLQQSVVVNQQGVVAIELIMRTNKELIRGVDRAINTTLSALTVAVTVATAVAHQRVVLDKILGVQKVTEDMIAGTARMLKENVAETNKLASETQLDMDTLRQAFADIQAALDDVSSFRRQALPKMAQTILELDQMTSDQGKLIENLEQGKKMAGELIIEAA